MGEITTLHYLVLSAGLFMVGTIGVLTRRNVIIILMSIELILNAVNLNLVAFSRLYGLHGQIFAIFVITDAAAEAAVGLGIIIAFFRNKETVNVDEVDLLEVVELAFRPASRAKWSGRAGLQASVKGKELRGFSPSEKNDVLHHSLRSHAPQSLSAERDR